MSMNTIPAIASELAEGALQLESEHWVHVPLGGHRELRLLRNEHGSRIVAVIAQEPMKRAPAEDEALHTALLLLGAETRWTEGFLGGIDDNGSACIAVTLNEPCHAQQVEEILGRMLERLVAICEAACNGASGFMTGKGGATSQPSFTWGLP